MPKIRTRRAAAKRFDLTESGKAKHHKAYRSHLLSKKTPKRKRTLRTKGVVDWTDLNRVKRMLGV
jgi:large subunit ribosomal protein L35